ncbi:DinB family protein [Mucilaginibacter sp. SMC90]|uniref:DinB family protein n=1 Tax=Mucilaginibacter sp. SMC90 TaxID=2929803 RepID=UPI001FB333BC|nr:DinB family protein [Mucilaginibacter sp. SMC90]UOE48605.1 DinB family protein [Mucilaginibacter sp. SMC90]
MSIANERKAIDAALDEYRRQLDLIPDELFDVTPPDGSWSFAEVYSHIMQATLGSSIALERCTHGNCEPTKKGINWEGRILLLLGKFPPVKTKVPNAVNDKMAANKISKEDAKNLIIKCRKRVDTTAPLIPASSNASKYKHPRLGMLNAKQWFKFIRIHLQHHLKQLDRTKNKFNTAK